MLCYANRAGSSGTPTTGGFTLNAAPGNGGSTFIFPWIATARGNDTAGNGSAAGGKFDQATRTSSTVFMRGLKETIEIQTSSGTPWQWRRVCFTTKNVDITLGINAGGTYSGFLTGANGYGRYVYNGSSGNAPDNAMLTNLRALIFKGSLGSDWSDYMTAPLDSTRISIKYDVTRTIRSGNDSGVIRKYSIWHGMNKNLVYDDEEAGGDEIASFYSTHGKQGMGDYYIIDFIRPALGASSGDSMLFQPQSILYWHEK